MESSKLLLSVEHIVQLHRENIEHLLSLGDSPGFAIHQHRYDAKKALMDMLHELLDAGEDAVEDAAAGVPSLLLSLVAARTMFLIGKCMHESMETLEGYRWAAEGTVLLLRVLSSGDSTSVQQLEAVLTLLKEPAHVAPEHPYLTDVDSTSTLKLLGGLCMLVEQYIFLASAWSRWGNDNAALKLIQRAQHLINLSRRTINMSWKQEIMDAAVREHEASSAVRDRDQEAQQNALAERLRARRSRTVEAPPLSLRDVALECPTHPDPSPLGGESPQIVPLTNTRQWIGWGRDTAVTMDTLRSGSGESSEKIKELGWQVSSCFAQILKAHNELQKSAYYCHRALADQLNSGIVKEPSEWVTAVLGLTDWYLLEMDLSHAEHCLAAAKLIVERTKCTVDTPLVAYLEASLVSKLLILHDAVRRAGASEEHGREVASLFDSPLLQTEEYRNAPANAIDAKGTVDAHFSERISFLIPGLPPPRKELLIEWGTQRSADVVANLLSQLLAKRCECFQTISIDTDCERYLELQRMTASALGVAYHFIGDDDLLVQRLDILRTILKAQLNPVAFRNVIRQAEYDAGVVTNLLAENAEDASSKDTLRGESCSYFRSFLKGFDNEASEASRAGRQTHDIFDASDYPSYAVGSMQLATGLLRLRQREEAARVLTSLIVLLEGHPNSLVEYPMLKEHMTQCQEMLSLLRQAGVQATEAPQAQNAVKTSAAKASVVHGAAAAPRVKAVRPLGGSKPK